MEPYDEGKKWYLIYTKPRQEERARENLERQGYQLFIPKIKVLKHQRTKWCSVIEPLFPNYLFIKLGQIDENWLPIRSTFGVSTIVRFGILPANVSEDIVTIIRQRSETYTINEEDLFQDGQPVRIITGPMKGLEAVFHCMSGQQRAFIFLEFLGAVNKVKIDVNALVPAFC